MIHWSEANVANRLEAGEAVASSHSSRAVRALVFLSPWFVDQPVLCCWRPSDAGGFCFGSRSIRDQSPSQPPRRLAVPKSDQIKSTPVKLFGCRTVRSRAHRGEAGWFDNFSVGPSSEVRTVGGVGGAGGMAASSGSP